jgi:hypothetical protein
VGVDVVFDVAPYNDSYYSRIGHIGEPIAPPDDPQAFTLAPVTMQVGDVLVFKLTVENYGKVPIRTSARCPNGLPADRRRHTRETEQPGAAGIKCDFDERLPALGHRTADDLSPSTTRPLTIPTTTCSRKAGVGRNTDDQPGRAAQSAGVLAALIHDDGRSPFATTRSAGASSNCLIQLPVIDHELWPLTHWR